ncbi:hypothetical protein U9M48_030529 [Paspalum notatum var. saurae]|uniref:Aspartic peptidase DDI1-type domain-containing protein n=1 Tax=Paspalum notatum var. saurae TaxID=547442 RepID=A0AAQ3U0W2_PASNO
MASNQGWRQERANNKPHGVHHIDGSDMLTAKMDLLLKKLGETPKAVPTPHILEVRVEGTGKAEAEPEEEEVTSEPLVKEAPKSAPHEFYDTTVLPFPERQKKTSVDNQFGKFVEVIKKLYVNIPLLDVMQVPTYAKYLKDILNNKKPLPSTEVVHLTEECSAAILNKPPQKKKDHGNPTISCSIGTQHFDQALCDLGASVIVMPKVVFDKLTHATLAPTAMCLQLANQSIRYPVGIAQDIPVKIRNFLIPVDFVVLNMEIYSKTPLILGRPFLSTAEANIDVGAGEVHLNINGRRETFALKPKVEQCRQVKTFKFKCQAPRETPREKIELLPSKSKVDSLILAMEKILLDGEAHKLKADRRAESQRRASMAKPPTKEAGGKTPVAKVVATTMSTPKEWRKKEEETPKAKPEKSKTQKQKAVATKKAWRAKVAAQTAVKFPSSADTEPKV